MSDWNESRLQQCPPPPSCRAPGVTVAMECERNSPNIRVYCKKLMFSILVQYLSNMFFKQLQLAKNSKIFKRCISFLRLFLLISPDDSERTVCICLLYYLFFIFFHPVSVQMILIPNVVAVGLWQTKSTNDWSLIMISVQATFGLRWNVVQHDFSLGKICCMRNVKPSWGSQPISVHGFSFGDTCFGYIFSFQFEWFAFNTEKSVMDQEVNKASSVWKWTSLKPVATSRLSCLPSLIGWLQAVFHRGCRNPHAITDSVTVTFTSRF